MCDDAKLMVDIVYHGTMPAPYNTTAVAGLPIEALDSDDGGGAQK